MLRGKREATTVEAYRTGKKIRPRIWHKNDGASSHTRCYEKVVISDIMDTISTGSSGDGKIFVKEITGAYDIASKEAGEKAAISFIFSEHQKVAMYN